MATALTLSLLSSLSRRAAGSQTRPSGATRRSSAAATTASPRDGSVLVVDSDETRAQALVVSFRLLGCSVAVARTLDDAARLVSSCDIVAIDDDAFGAAGVAFLSTIARNHAHVFRCAAARWSRFSDVRGVAQYVFAKPFSGAVVADALVAARARHANGKRVERVVAQPR